MSTSDAPPPTDPRLAAAVAAARTDAERTLADQIELTRIPAPPFAEEARGRAVHERFEALGLPEVSVDAVGNVVASRPGTDDAAPLVLSAHLDTVFPAGTPIDVRRDGTRVEAPGICDDGRGLAVLLAVARTLAEADLRTRRPLLFVATVGEEGPGDLRGARHLVGPGGAAHRAAGFVSIDGAGLDRIVTRGLGSIRLRVTLRGPGGHSWQDFGVSNPIHLLAGITAELVGTSLPQEPPTTLTVARWGGGTSVNAIPEEAWIELDIRSERPEGPEALEAAMARILETRLGRHALDRPGEIVPLVQLLGRRPSGETAEDDPLVVAAVRATREVGATPVLTCSSTDANAAMAAGIPAVTIGGGGTAGGAHTAAEWYDDRDGAEGVARALLATLYYAGISP